MSDIIMYLDLRVNFRKSEGKIDQNDKVFCRITSIFGASKPPRSGPSETALRLRSLPEGCPPQAKIFLYLIRIHRSSYWKLSLFCDFSSCILDHISIVIMKNTMWNTLPSPPSHHQDIQRGKHDVMCP